MTQFNISHTTINSEKTAVLNYNYPGLASTIPVSLNGVELSTCSSAVHLGITHGTARNINKVMVEERIKATTKIVYALFSAGFHGRNGLTPVLIQKLWLTYILPRLLYST